MDKKEERVKQKSNLLQFLIIVLIVVAAGAIYYFFFLEKGDPNSPLIGEYKLETAYAFGDSAYDSFELKSDGRAIYYYGVTVDGSLNINHETKVWKETENGFVIFHPLERVLDKITKLFPGGENMNQSDKYFILEPDGRYLLEGTITEKYEDAGSMGYYVYKLQEDGTFAYDSRVLGSMPGNDDGRHFRKIS